MFDSQYEVIAGTPPQYLTRFVNLTDELQLPGVTRNGTTGSG